jgi:hypothetical protein
MGWVISLIVLLIAAGVVAIMQSPSTRSAPPAPPAHQVAQPASPQASQVAVPHAAPTNAASPGAAVSPASSVPPGDRAQASPAASFAHWLGRPLTERWVLDAPGSTRGALPAWPAAGTIEYGFTVSAPGIDQERRLTARVWFPEDRTSPRVTFAALSLGQEANAGACTVIQEHGILRWLDLPDEGMPADLAAQAQEAARWLISMAGELPVGPVTSGQHFTLGGTPFCIARVTPTRIDAVATAVESGAVTSGAVSYPYGSGTYDDLSLYLDDQGGWIRIERCMAHRSANAGPGQDATSSIRRLIVFPTRPSATEAAGAAPPTPTP